MTRGHMTRGHMMRSHGLFLLLYLLGLCWGTSYGQSNGTCPTGVTCAQLGPAESFLQCVGLPSTDTGAHHLQRLKAMMEALMDLYTFMRTSVKGVPVLSLQGALELRLAEPLQNEELVQMWMEVKMAPLLQSVSKQMLSCLSIKSFSCSTYSIMVQEFSQHFSEMDPVRQKWIYDFFMYPFLSRDGVDGCVEPGQDSADWLMKNFGAFSAMARVKDFTQLNMVFSGLEVLDLLTPEQKADLLLSPGVAGLDNGTLHLVFHSMMGPPGLTTTSSPDQNWTTTAPYGYTPAPTPDPYLPTTAQPTLNTVNQVMSGFIGALKPFSSFVHEFVDLNNRMEASEISSSTLAQFFLNFTLSELAQVYSSDQSPDFDVTDVDAWYQQVVLPLLQRFLPEGQQISSNISMAFHNVFYLDHGMNNDTVSELDDVCSLILDHGQCGLTDVVSDVAGVLSCASQTDFTLTEPNVLGLLTGLSQRLSSLLNQLSSLDLNTLSSDLRQIFSGGSSSALTQQHLTDPEFIQIWFRVKLLPLLPDVRPELLSCLSSKNFSCLVYQTIVSDLSQHMDLMEADLIYRRRVYDHFIYPFLLNHNSTDPQCVSSANSSAQWLQDNFGSFSWFANITDFYNLNPLFSGVEALSLLSPRQTAQLLLLPLAPPPQQVLVVQQVFQYLLTAPHDRGLMEVLEAVMELAPQVNTSCAVYTQMLVSLYGAVPSVSVDLEPFIWASIEDLILISPQECVPENITCPVTQTNATNICRQFNSSEVWSDSSSLCDVSLEGYACSELENFTANQLASLLSCDLPGNSSHSRVLWKIVLTKLSSILDQALDLLAATPMVSISPSAPEILDVIGEMRVSLSLSDQDLRSEAAVSLWFDSRLRGLLPHSSGTFLRCLSTRNISCSSYQQILQIFIQDFDQIMFKQQQVVLKDYILRFLSQSVSGPGCLSQNSSLWLEQNLGPFSQFLTLSQILQINPFFSPLDALPLLTTEQTVHILTAPLSLDKDLIINKLFDFYSEEPAKQRFPEFLSYLPQIVPQADLSCSAFKTLFNRLDLAVSSVSLETEYSIIRTKISLSPHIPQGCVIYDGQCTVTIQNETEICVGVNSTSVQLTMNQTLSSGRLCDFTVEELACAPPSLLSALTPVDLVSVLSCSRPDNYSGTRASWKLLLSKVSLVLDQALDLMANTTLDPTQAALPLILDAVREIRLDTFPLDQINHPIVVQLWFDQRLRPFLSSASTDFLFCLTTKSLNCSTFQHIVHLLSLQQPQMSLSKQMTVYTYFIKVYLSNSVNNTADPSCVAHTNSSADWLMLNLGAFSGLAMFSDLTTMYPHFNAMEALSVLTVRQLAEVSTTPGQLTSAAQVSTLMRYVPDQRLAAFFDDFSPVIKDHQSQYPSEVRSAMLEVVFNRANLSDHAVPDSVVSDWLHLRMAPLLYGLSPLHVAPYFSILSGRNCSIQQLGVSELDSIISSLSPETQTDIHNHIMLSLMGSEPLLCYGDNYNYSFYRFLESAFMGFQFPNLTSFLALIPHDRMPQLLNSMPVSDLGDFLRRPRVVDNEAELCQIFNNYRDTTLFLETESLPADLHSPILVCVWPLALRSGPSEVDTWFDQALLSYLPLLTSSLLSTAATYNASCPAFQKLVLVMGGYNYTGRDFNRAFIFSSIRAYLTSASAPRCYNASVPGLDSTAWFFNYIGPFFSFMTLDDLNMFGSPENLKVFTVNPLNLALLNHTALPQNLTDYYTELVYLQNSNFNPLLLPLLCRCVAPGQAFRQLDANQSMIVLHNLTTLCPNLDPQISAALAENFGTDIDANTIETLGNESSGLSTGQIKTIKPTQLLQALVTLSVVSDWNEGQARAIVQLVLAAGMQLNASSLVMLGTLVVGVSSSDISRISGSELLNASKNPGFIQNLITAPTVVQQAFVSQLIAVDSSSDGIIGNVPDDMAAEIPRTLLLTISSTSSVLQEVNKKKWKQQQVELFFSVVAVENATATLGSTNNLSSSVLQGFTCTGVRTFQKTQINQLVKSCRRKGKNKVKLVETQLTCMYFYIQNASDATVFSLYPPDVLLYYDYSLVPSGACRSYFQELADADFSVFSSTLSYKKTELFTNAKTCLGINSTSLSADAVSVLGNMCCTLEGSYIQNSDPSILSVLMTCPSLTDGQITAVQALLQTGKTPYGAPSSWSLQTLKDLGMLPLFLKSTFYDNFSTKIKRDFLKYFLDVLKANGVSRSLRASMKQEIQASIKSRSRRSVACTVGEITQVTISDDTFPFDYSDVTQFDACLHSTTVKDNLGAITNKVDQPNYLRVVLNKLNQAYATNSTTTIPEDQVQLLGPASRVATLDDISTWTITTIDTLSALMNSANGAWNTTLAKAIITKYLSTAGNSLTSSALNMIRGANLCSLDASVLANISTKSLKEADALTVSSCSLEQKKALFTVALQAFSSNTRAAATATEYQLMQPYLGGATLSYINGLASANPNMDVPTFSGLDPSVLQSVTVNTATAVLGSNVNQLVSYQKSSGVQVWITNQPQSELDRMGLGLTGGIRTDTTTQPSNTTGATTTTASGATTTPGTGATTTPGTGATTTPGTGATTTPGTGATTSPGTGATTTPGTGATTNPGTGATTTPGTRATTTPGTGATTTPGTGATTTPSTGATTTPGTGATTTPGTGATTTPGTAKPSHSAPLQAPGGLQLLLLLLLLLTTQHVFV